MNYRMRWRKSYWRDIKTVSLGHLVASIGYFDGAWDVIIDMGLIEYLARPFYHRVDAKRWAECRLMAIMIAKVEVQ
jgi:hypothetical protein